LVINTHVQFCVKACLKLANLKTSRIVYVDATSFNSRADINGGVMASVPLFSSFFLQPEFIYSGQGQSIRSPMAKATINYDYINLPGFLNIRRFRPVCRDWSADWLFNKRQRKD
jgi:hypothetical protein